MRQIKIAPEEYYHVFNRAVSKQVIFHDTRDYARFLFLILYFQSPLTFPQISRITKHFVKSSAFDTLDADKVIEKRTVELISFCIMPNHFHLILKELDDGGISVYMQRILTSYSKYYNAKYVRSGHVFQGPYKAVHISDDQQLLYLSAYVHRNPREISKWFNHEDKYPWSSYQDYLEEGRWGRLLLPDIILMRYKDKKKYKKFVDTSTAKLIKGELVNLEHL